MLSIADRLDAEAARADEVRAAARQAERAAREAMTVRFDPAAKRRDFDAFASSR